MTAMSKLMGLVREQQRRRASINDDVTFFHWADFDEGRPAQALGLQQKVDESHENFVSGSKLQPAQKDRVPCSLIISGMLVAPDRPTAQAASRAWLNVGFAPESDRMLRCREMTLRATNGHRRRPPPDHHHVATRVKPMA
jgi:hypothetical protein